MSQHLSCYGIYNDTSKGWCFITTDDDQSNDGFRGSLIACEKGLVEFRKEYPTNQYRIAMHADDCYMRMSGGCCEPKKE